MKTMILAAFVGVQSDPNVDDLRPPHRCDESFYSQEGTELVNDDVRITSHGLTEQEFERVSTMLIRVRQGLEDLGLHRGGILAARLRHADNYLDPGNCYSNENTLTIRLPCVTNYLDGGPLQFDPVYATLDVIAESCWTRVVRPTRWMPLAAREAINRLFARALLAEFGKDGAWWPGEARPREGSLLNLDADHPVVVRRDQILVRLEQYVDALGEQAMAAEGADPTADPHRLGVQAFSGKATMWGRRRLDGAQAYAELESLLTPATDDSGLQLIPDKEFKTREPYDVAALSTRSKGLDAEIPQGMKLLLWYGDATAPPDQFLSVRNGDPTVLFRLPSKGTWRMAHVEILARRRGSFADESFDVVMMDQAGRELFRWSYPILALPEAEAGNAAWISLANTCYPYATPFFHMAVEFPELDDDQDVEIGFWEREGADHSFWRQDPVFRSTETVGDFAFKVQLNARGVPNAFELMKLIRRHIKTCNL